MSVKVRTVKGKIYLDIYIKGRRWWESTGLSVSLDKQVTKEAYRLAETLRAKKELSIVSRQNGLHDPTIGRMLLSEYLEEATKGKSTQYAIHKVVHWVKILRGTTRMEDLNASWMEKFQESIISEAGVSLQTCEHYCTTLRTQFKKALRDKILCEDPGAGVPHIKVKEKMKPHLEVWEVEKLIATPITGQKTGIGPAIRQAWLFAIATGLRISDIRTLRWSDIDRENRRISKAQIKTGQIVNIPIKDEAWALIKDTEQGDPFVFPRIASIKNIENTSPYLKKWGIDAGLTKAIGWHIARHTDATQLLESGADVYTVMKLLGHTKIETTMKYAAVTNKKRQSAVDNLPEYGFDKKV